VVFFRKHMVHLPDDWHKIFFEHFVQHVSDMLASWFTGEFTSLRAAHANFKVLREKLLKDQSFFKGTWKEKIKTGFCRQRLYSVLAERLRAKLSRSEHFQVKAAEVLAFLADVVENDKSAPSEDIRNLASSLFYFETLRRWYPGEGALTKDIVATKICTDYDWESFVANSPQFDAHNHPIIPCLIDAYCPLYEEIVKGELSEVFLGKSGEGSVDSLKEFWDRVKVIKGTDWSSLRRWITEQIKCPPCCGQNPPTMDESSRWKKELVTWVTYCSKSREPRSLRIS